MEKNVLNILAQYLKQFVSNNSIAKKLNISPRQVDELISNLINQGFNISIESNKGYRLGHPMDVLDETIITSLLKNHHSISLFDTIDSTNTYLRNNAKEFDYQHVVIADAQTAGKGRQQRSFYSSPSAGIYFSILLEPQPSIQQALRITALTSVAIYSAIKELYDFNIEIKWVNDLIIDDLKVGGILCEGDLEINPLSFNNVVIGIGLNIKAMDFPDDIKQTATYLENHLTEIVSRNQLIATIINYFDKYYNDELDYLSIYRKQSSVINKTITVYQNNQKYQAFVLDIAQDGSLIIQRDNEIIHLTSGEITIRY